MKRKKSDRIKAKEKAWSIFSKYIRLRDSSKYGYCICCTCGKRGYWEKDGMQAGHFLAGRGSAILFEERCVHAQCSVCNGGSRVHMGNKHKDIAIEYFLFMERKYGRQEIDRLIKLKNIAKKYTIFDYKELEKKYVVEVEKLKSLKILEER